MHSYMYQDVHSVRVHYTQLYLIQVHISCVCPCVEFIITRCSCIVSDVQSCVADLYCEKVEVQSCIL